MNSSRVGEQLLLALDWGKEPWQGRTPRSLTKIARGTCVVDKSEVGWPSREAQCFGTDPAQFTLFLKGKSDGTLF